MAEPSSKKMQRYRARLRAEGLRPVQLWALDLRDPAIRARFQAQSRALRDHTSEGDIAPFLDAALEEIDDWKP